MMSLLLSVLLVLMLLLVGCAAAPFLDSQVVRSSSDNSSSQKKQECPEGSRFSHGLCLKEVLALPTKGCPVGFELYENSCESIEAAVPSCPTGFQWKCKRSAINLSLTQPRCSCEAPATTVPRKKQCAPNSRKVILEEEKLDGHSLQVISAERFKCEVEVEDEQLPVCNHGMVLDQHLNKCMAYKAVDSLCRCPEGFTHHKGSVQWKCEPVKSTPNMQVVLDSEQQQQQQQHDDDESVVAITSDRSSSSNMSSSSSSSSDRNSRSSSSSISGSTTGGSNSSNGSVITTTSDSIRGDGSNSVRRVLLPLGLDSRNIVSSFSSNGRGERLSRAQRRRYEESRRHNQQQPHTVTSDMGAAAETAAQASSSVVVSSSPPSSSGLISHHHASSVSADPASLYLVDMICECPTGTITAEEFHMKTADSTANPQLLSTAASAVAAGTRPDLIMPMDTTRRRRNTAGGAGRTLHPADATSSSSSTVGSAVLDNSLMSSTAQSSSSPSARHHPLPVASPLPRPGKGSCITVEYHDLLRKCDNSHSTTTLDSDLNPIPTNDCVNLVLVDPVFVCGEGFIDSCAAATKLPGGGIGGVGGIGGGGGIFSNGGVEVGFGRLVNSKRCVCKGAKREALVLTCPEGWTKVEETNGGDNVMCKRKSSVVDACSLGELVSVDGHNMCRYSMRVQKTGGNATTHTTTTTAGDDDDDTTEAMIS